MKCYCPFCKKETEYSLTKRLIKEFKKVKIDTYENVPICSSCKNDLYVSDIEDKNTKRIYKAYREKTDLISASDIIKLREKYNISQRELTSILGFGKMTINRYENGELPSKSQSDYLKLLINDNIKFISKVKEAYKNNTITEKTYNKIVSKNNTNNNLTNNELYEIDFIDNVKSYLNAMLYRNPDIYNGYQSFDLDKTENIISYIAHNVKNLTITSLNKYLWYIDMLSFNKRAVSITGLTYEKQKYGPIISNKKYVELTLLDKLYQREEIENNDGYMIKIISKNNYDLNMLSNSEKEIIDTVIKKLKNMTVSNISLLSHKEDGWSKTKLLDNISFDYASNLKTI